MPDVPVTKPVQSESPHAEHKRTGLARAGNALYAIPTALYGAAAWAFYTALNLPPKTTRTVTYSQGQEGSGQGHSGWGSGHGWGGQSGWGNGGSHSGWEHYGERSINVCFDAVKAFCHKIPTPTNVETITITQHLNPEAILLFLVSATAVGVGTDSAHRISKYLRREAARTQA